MTEKKALHLHHIVERVEVGTSNHPFNLAIICSNCHALVHAGQIKIIGVYPSTNSQGRMLVFEKDGISNAPGITEPYFKFTPESMKLKGK